MHVKNLPITFIITKWNIFYKVGISNKNLNVFNMKKIYILRYVQSVSQWSNTFKYNFYVKLSYYLHDTLYIAYMISVYLFIFFISKLVKNMLTIILNIKVNVVFFFIGIKRRIEQNSSRLWKSRYINIFWNYIGKCSLYLFIGYWQSYKSQTRKSRSSLCEDSTKWVIIL